MLTWIISDHVPLTHRLRQLVGHQCPAENHLRVESPSKLMTSDLAQDQLVLVTLSPNPDQSLVTVRLLRSNTRLTIITVGPRDPNLILEAMRAGADDYVDETDGLEYELATALQRQAAQRSGRSSTQGRLIAIAGANGGSGRSIVAVNLAILLAKAQSRSCLMDLDPGGGSCAAMLNVNGRHTILDLAKLPEKVDRSTIEQSLVAHDSGVNLLAGAGEMVPPSLLDGEFVDRLVRGAKMLFPSVLLDLHNLADEVLVKRLHAHDTTLILVTRLDFNSICGTGRMLKYWEQCGHSRKNIIVVANRRGQPGEVPLKKVEQALSLRIQHFLPDDPALVNRSINHGIPVVMEERDSPLGHSLAALSSTLLGESGNGLRKEPATRASDGLFTRQRLASIISRLTGT